MSRYRVKFYKGNYRERQRNASRDNAVCYVEHHFNAASNPEAGYTLVVVGSNASKASVEFGKDYCTVISQHFGTRLVGEDGVVKGGFGGRGGLNVYYTKCPAVLLEPLFCSNPSHAQIIKSERGQQILAECLVWAIKQNFPNGGLVAFSVGHKYKLSSPRDCGAAVYGGGTEADYAEIVLQKAAAMLTEEIKIEAEPVALTFSEDDEPAIVPHASSGDAKAAEADGGIPLPAPADQPAETAAPAQVEEIPTETKVIPNPEPVGFRAKIAKLFAGLTGGTLSLATIKEATQITISPETLQLLKYILPTLLVLFAVSLIVWYIAEKVTNWKLVQLQAEINSDKSKHDIEVSK